MDKKKVVVGMSGGVDSSVAAALLKKQGHEVAGVFMEIYDESAAPAEKGRHACYGPGEKEDLEAALSVAGKLGIELHVLDLRERYKTDILRFFVEEYAQGRTPNPCVRCNRKLKFGAITAELNKMGVEFDTYATGHYARIAGGNGSAGRLFLLKAFDKTKDQSYFLYHLKERQLRGLMFPLGEHMKTEVRKLAADFELDVNDKPESQDFIAGGHRRLLEGSAKPGPVLDNSGRILGQHEGLAFYTVGQRRGLRIGGGAPLFVLAKDSERNVIIVGPEKELYSDGLVATDVSWVNCDRLEAALHLAVRIRYRHQEAAAEVIPMGADTVRVMFDEPQRAVAPGQAVVFYDGETVMGGGIIEKEVEHGYGR